MTADNLYAGIKEVMQITPDSISQCETCRYLPKDLADAINHYLSHHGYKLLHIGSQSGTDSSGNIISDVIALLGK